MKNNKGWPNQPREAESAQSEVTQHKLSFYISEFSSKIDNQPKKKQITWGIFLSLIKCPIICNTKDGKAFAPATFNGSRSKENAQEIFLLVLDCDNGTPLEEITTKCKNLGYSFAIYTTFSHTREKHKFRVVFPLATPIPANIYFLLWNWAANKFPNIDLQAKDTSRMFYYPAIKTKDSPFYFEFFDGNLLDWRELKDLVVLIEEPPKQQYQQSFYNHISTNKAKSAYVQAALDDEVARIRSSVEGERNSTVNKAAFALAQLLHTNLIDETTIRIELESAALSLGLSKDEAKRTIKSGIAAGRKQPRIIDESNYSASYQKPSSTQTPAKNKAEEKQDKPIPETTSLKSLWNKVFPDIDYLVPDILPTGGVCLICGSPKTGKTNLCTNLGLALACGGKFLGQQVAKTNVLLLNLEDGERRLKQRVEAIIAENEQPPDNFDYISGVTSLNAVVAINQWLEKQTGRSLVIIDTLAKFRGIMKHNQNLYDFDYQSPQLLRELAEKYQVTFLIIHHTNKLVSEDILNTVSGTLGLTGACDNIFILKRARGNADAELHIIGRDMEDKQLALRYSFPYWTLLGNAEEYSVSKERRFVIELLKEHGTLSLKQLLDYLQLELPNTTYHSTKQLLYRMTKDGLTKSIDKGKYMLVAVNDSRDGKQNTVTTVISATSVASVTSVTKEENTRNNTYKKIESNTNIDNSNGHQKSSVTMLNVVNKDDNVESNASNIVSTDSFSKKIESNACNAGNASNAQIIVEATPDKQLARRALACAEWLRLNSKLVSRILLNNGEMLTEPEQYCRFLHSQFKQGVQLPNFVKELEIIETTISIAIKSLSADIN